MDLELRGRVAVVTGSSRGLGLASALALAAEGCRVCICARGAERLAEAHAQVAAVSTADDVRAVQADLSTSVGIDAVIDAAVESFGGIDVLVNSVAVARGGTLEETTDAEWQAALDHTLYPAIRASRRAVPLMRARGGGSIIMIASIWGRESGGRMTYNAVKAAEISLAKAMAHQYARDGIRVNSVAPGSTSFPGGTWYVRQQEDPDGMRAFVEREIPSGRFGRPEETGALVAFLASPKASWITGACVPVDGGQSRSLI